MFAAVASIVVLVQLLTRQVRLSASERSPLMALGATNGQLLAESTGRAAVPIVLGSIIGALGSTLFSGIFPTGFVRTIELHPGFHADLTVLILGTLAAVLALVAVTTLVLLGTAPSARVGPSLNSVEVIARRMHSIAAATGMRFAFARRPGERASARSALFGLTLTLASLFASVCFASSLVRLINEPARFGLNYDAQFDNGAGTLSTDLLATLQADTEVAGVTLYADGEAGVGDTSMFILGFQVLKGDAGPVVLGGRLPVALDEVALGRTTAETLGVSVDDTIRLQGSNEALPMRITGLVVMPNIGLSAGAGQGAMLTLDAIAQLKPHPKQVPTPVVRLRAGAPPDTLQRLGEATGVQPALWVASAGNHQCQATEIGTGRSGAVACNTCCADGGPRHNHNAASSPTRFRRAPFARG